MLLVVSGGNFFLRRKDMTMHQEELLAKANRILDDRNTLVDMLLAVNKKLGTPGLHWRETSALLAEGNAILTWQHDLIAEYETVKRLLG